MKRIAGVRRGLAFANVMSVIAVFIALGGASYAAVNLPKNSVGTKQLKGKSVGKKQLKGNSVNSNKVKNFSLQANDFKKGQIPSGPTGPVGLPGEDGQMGATGATGFTGVTGPQGDKGNPGATNVSARYGPGSALVGASQQTSDTASCNPGEVATGGGYFLTGNATHSRVYNNLAEGAAEAPTQWMVSVYNDSDATASVGVTARVNCSAP
ncbi:MAG: collagen-like protein [Thermoleophilia bacterium]|nr:collagen-like protein [Thermoleophilia bacterium]